MRITRFIILMLLTLQSYADSSCCCQGYGGISYADSSMGRYVCRNGYISQCYSTRHAIMDLQKLKGCCLWEGGVEKITIKGEVVCRDGNVSEPCTIERQNHNK